MCDHSFVVQTQSRKQPSVRERVDKNLTVMVVDDTLKLYPPAHQPVREAPSGTELPGQLRSNSGGINQKATLDRLAIPEFETYDA
jgi:hypothetical protein